MQLQKIKEMNVTVNLSLEIHTLGIWKKWSTVESCSSTRIHQQLLWLEIT